ncbi:MAG TPA: hypothetical protein VM536_22955, partial [Chloroflexia bacterium]|nr:hypothetical protein [Chloroflexia bacterium]
MQRRWIGRTGVAGLLALAILVPAVWLGAVRLPAVPAPEATRPPAPVTTAGAPARLPIVVETWEAPVAGTPRPPTPLPNPVATAAFLTVEAGKPTPPPPPTPLPPPPSLSLYQDQQRFDFPLTNHGAPPFRFGIVAYLNKVPAQPVTCTQAQWDWGDGRQETLPCGRIEQTASGFVLTGSVARHTYTAAGVYSVTVRMALDNGREMGAGPQMVRVSPYDPPAGLPPAAYWGLWALAPLLAVGVVWRTRRATPRRRWTFRGLVLLGLLTFLPPFSYLPNPVGLLAGLTNVYAYDPRLPFVDRMVVADDPTVPLDRALDGLRGQTGLDPLDPRQPLAGYEFQQVRLDPATPDYAWVTARIAYGDGSTRTYEIPVYASARIPGVYRRYSFWNWAQAGLGRVTAAQQPAGDIPAAGAATPLQLGPPQRLTLPAAALRLDNHTLANWVLGYAGAPPPQHLAWAPAGDGFLLLAGAGTLGGDLWRVPVPGGDPVRLASGVLAYSWAPG